MSRSFWIFSAVFVCAVAIPHFALAAVNTNFFGPIVPNTGTCSCPGRAPDFGCVLYVLQNVLNTAVSFGVIVMTLFIAVAGFRLMANPTNPENRSKARASLLNLVIGLAIILTAWLLVDTVMKVIYSSSAEHGPVQLGVWNKILFKDPTKGCFEPKEIQGIGQLISAEKNAVEGGVAAGTPPLLTGGRGPACSGSAVQSAAARGGVTMSNAEANTIACIAGPESACGSTNPNYNWDGKKNPLKPSTAWGPFQITLKGNSACLNNSACQKAAGVNGSLNCRNAFDSHGHSIPGQLLNQCKTAAATLSCSAVAADCIVKGSNGSYGAWTNNKDSTAAHQSCVANNSGR